VDTLKKVEAAGFEEVILNFNVRLKPHTQVRRRWIASRAMSRRPLKARANGASLRRIGVFAFLRRCLFPRAILIC
jgi:hypothetical protein